MYSTIVPCPICARMIINAQVRKVVYCGDYSDTQGLELLKQVGIEVVKLKAKDKAK